jgi:hypothetical protein
LCGKVSLSIFIFHGKLDLEEIREWNEAKIKNKKGQQKQHQQQQQQMSSISKQKRINFVVLFAFQQ